MPISACSLVALLLNVLRDLRDGTEEEGPSFPVWPCLRKSASARGGRVSVIAAHVPRKQHHVLR